MNNILCVDDTPSNLFILQSLLDNYQDEYNILTATNGNEALEILLCNKIDLILLDVMMPILDGFETAKIVKQNKNTKNIPIIFLTAKTDEETIENAFLYGNDYISKPYNQFELLTRIKNQIQILSLEKKVDEHIIFSKTVLDSSPNIIFVQDSNCLIDANKKFFNFFNTKNIEEFNEQNNITQLFVKYNTFISKPNIINTADYISKFFHKEKVVAIDIHKVEPRIFKTHVSTIENTNRHIIILIDITNEINTSKNYEIKATYDELTNIYNRGKFNEFIKTHFNDYKNTKNQHSLAIFDIDFFKIVNDKYGHNIGDETLIKFATVLNNQMRDNDIFARWGGEEFVLLLPNTDINKAYQVVERLRKLIEDTHFKIVDKKTCSIGITEFMQNDTIDSVLIRADEALYEAKTSGRNKVCIK